MELCGFRSSGRAVRFLVDFYLLRTLMLEDLVWLLEVARWRGVHTIVYGWWCVKWEEEVKLKPVEYVLEQKPALEQCVWSSS